MAKQTKQTQTNSHYQISAKVGTKGGVSIYGLQRFPVTLYADQLEAVLDKADELRAFMKANRSELKAKPTEGGGPAGSTAL